MTHTGKYITELEITIIRLEQEIKELEVKNKYLQDEVDEYHQG